MPLYWLGRHRRIKLKEVLWDKKCLSLLRRLASGLR